MEFIKENLTITLETDKEYFIGLTDPSIQEIGKKILFKEKELYILPIMETMWANLKKISQMVMVHNKLFNKNKMSFK